MLHAAASNSDACARIAECRATGEMLLDELAEVFQAEAMATFAVALQRRLQEAGAAKV
jgi:hypothetical protein